MQCRTLSAAAALVCLAALPARALSLGGTWTTSGGDGSLRAELGLFDQRLFATLSGSLYGSDAPPLAALSYTIPAGRWTYDLGLARQFVYQRYDWTELRGGASRVLLTASPHRQPADDIQFDDSETPAATPAARLALGGDLAVTRHRLDLLKTQYMNQLALGAWTAWTPGDWRLRAGARLYRYNRDIDKFAAALGRKLAPTLSTTVGSSALQLLALPGLALDASADWALAARWTLTAALAASRSAVNLDGDTWAGALTLGTQWRVGDLGFTASWQGTRAATWTHTLSLGMTWYDLW